MAKKRNKLLIVDGYNVLRSGQRYVHMRREEDYTHETFNKVREALISDVAAFAGTEYKAIIVFDGADNPESAGKTERIKKGYHAALVLDVCFAAVAFLVIETLHTQISSLFLGKDGTALAYQVSGDYMRWLGYFFIFMGIKMATDGVLRGLGIMRPFLIANMVNLAIRLSVALICAPRFGIDFVWLAVPAGWLANFLVSYAALRKSWPMDKAASAL